MSSRSALAAHLSSARSRRLQACGSDVEQRKQRLASCPMRALHGAVRVRQDQQQVARLPSHYRIQVFLT